MKRLHRFIRPRPARVFFLSRRSFGLSPGFGGLAEPFSPPVQHRDDFWIEVDKLVEGLDLPARWSDFVSIWQSSDDLHEMYETEDGQKVKAHGHYPGLSAQPFHDSDDFPFAAKLESEASGIMSELDSFMARSKPPGDVVLSNDERDDAWTTRFFNGSYGEDFHGVALVRQGEPV